MLLPSPCIYVVLLRRLSLFAGFYIAQGFYLQSDQINFIFCLCGNLLLASPEIQQKYRKLEIWLHA